MAVTVGELLFKLGADTSGLQRSLSTAEQQVKRTGDTLDRTGRQGQDGLGKVAKGAKDADREIDRMGKTTDDARAKVMKFGAQAIAAFAIADIVKDSIQAATSLGEAVNLTGNIFKDNKNQILEWSKTSADAFGLSQAAALSAASTFGGLFQNMGLDLDTSTQYSKDLVTLAGDLASAFDTTVPDAVQALGSALRGETEPIRRYNVMLSESAIKAEAVRLKMYSGTGEITNAAKAQASYNLILAQTITAQGDMARTAEDPANAARRLGASVEDLKAKVGEDLLPLWKELLSTASALTGWMSDHTEMIKTLALVAAGLYGAAKAGAIWNAAMLTMGRTSKGLAAAQAADFVMGVVPKQAGRMAGARGALNGMGATGAVALGAAAAGMTASLASNFGEVVGGSDRGRILKDHAGGSTVNGAMLGYSQDVLGFLTGGMADEWTGKNAVTDALNAEVYGAEAAEMNAANREKDRLAEESRDTLRALTEQYVKDGVITYKQGMDLIKGISTATIEETVASNEAAEKAMESTWQRRKQIFQAMNLLGGAPKMTETVNEEYTETDPVTGQEVTKTRQVEKEVALDPRAVMRDTKGAVAYQDQLVTDLARLERRGATQEALTALLDVEDSAPGTIRKIAEETGKKYIENLNDQLREGGRLSSQRDMIIENAVSMWDKIEEKGVRRARDAGRAGRKAYEEALNGEGEPTPETSEGPDTPNTWWGWTARRYAGIAQFNAAGYTTEPQAAPTTYINVDRQYVQADDPERFSEATRRASRRNAARGRGR